MPGQAPRPFLVRHGKISSRLIETDFSPCALLVQACSVLGELRQAVHRGVIPRDPSLFLVPDGSLRATVVRSKTTGPDKLVKSHLAHYRMGGHVKHGTWRGRLSYADAS